MKYYTVDRLEENLAILENRENKEIIEIPLSFLPKGIKEGDILKLIENQFILDIEETNRVKTEIKNKFRNLLK